MDVDLTRPLIAAGVDGPDDGAIAKGLASQANASIDHRAADGVAAPYLPEELTLGDHSLPVPEQVEDQLQDAGLDENRNSAVPDLEPILVNLELPPHESHPALPVTAPRPPLTQQAFRCFRRRSYKSAAHTSQQAALLDVHVGQQAVDEGAEAFGRAGLRDVLKCELGQEAQLRPLPSVSAGRAARGPADLRRAGERPGSAPRRRRDAASSPELAAKQPRLSQFPAVSSRFRRMNSEKR
jgi:hypothetical protein